MVSQVSNEYAFGNALSGKCHLLPLSGSTGGNYPSNANVLDNTKYIGYLHERYKTLDLTGQTTKTVNYEKYCSYLKKEPPVPARLEVE